MRPVHSEPTEPCAREFRSMCAYGSRPSSKDRKDNMFVRQLPTVSAASGWSSAYAVHLTSSLSHSSKDGWAQ